MTACKDSTQRTVRGGDETRAEQKRKAETFQNLHIRGNPIVLFNAWDAGSAKAVAAGGARAMAELEQSRPAVGQSPPPMVSQTASGFR